MWLPTHLWAKFTFNVQIQWQNFNISRWRCESIVVIAGCSERRDGNKHGAWIAWINVRACKSLDRLLQSNNNGTSADSNEERTGGRARTLITRAAARGRNIKGWSYCFANWRGQSLLLFTQRYKQRGRCRLCAHLHDILNICVLKCEVSLRCVYRQGRVSTTARFISSDKNGFPQ